MRKLIILFAAIILESCFATTISAQNSASVKGTAVYVVPITIAKAFDLNFGTVQIGSTAGTVILTPDGVRSKTGGVSLLSPTGTVQVGSFTVSGTPSSTYTISLPSSYTISSGANNMTVNAFSSSPSGAGILSSSGSQTINVGATLNVGASQTPGTYTNASGFSVTVNYN
jgi:hypothetical protein